MRFIKVRPGLGAEDRGRAAEHEAQADEEHRNGAVEEAFKSGEVCERHNKLQYFQFEPLGGARGCPIWTVLR